jgi:hypothetical protein
LWDLGKISKYQTRPEKLGKNLKLIKHGRKDLNFEKYMKQTSKRSVASTPTLSTFGKMDFSTDSCSRQRPLSTGTRSF